MSSFITKKFAIISNDVVENIIIADQEFVDKFYANAIDVTDIYCQIGDEYKDGKFIRPVVDELEA